MYEITTLNYDYVDKFYYIKSAFLIYYYTLNFFDYKIFNRFLKFF